METLAGRLAKLWGEFQVMMGADGANVTQISCQMRQLGLHVQPVGAENSVTVLLDQNVAKF